ncbi:MAG: SHOCT domain-containing protein [Acidimicrobiia bacterium]
MPLLNLFWTMLIFFMWVIWIWLLITVFIDIFRDKELNGVLKAVWVLFVIILPLLGVLVYLIARGDSMHERQLDQAVRQQKMANQYIRDVSGGATSSADELEKLAKLKAQGVLTEEEFAAQKAKLLA